MSLDNIALKLKLFKAAYSLSSPKDIGRGPQGRDKNDFFKNKNLNNITDLLNLHNDNYTKNKKFNSYDNFIRPTTKNKINKTNSITSHESSEIEEGAKSKFSEPVIPLEFNVNQTKHFDKKEKVFVRKKNKKLNFFFKNTLMKPNFFLRKQGKLNFKGQLSITMPGLKERLELEMEEMKNNNFGASIRPSTHTFGVRGGLGWEAVKNKKLKTTLPLGRGSVPKGNDILVPYTYNSIHSSLFVDRLKKKRLEPKNKTDLDFKNFNLNKPYEFYNLNTMGKLLKKQKKIINQSYYYDTENSSPVVQDKRSNLHSFIKKGGEREEENIFFNKYINLRNTKTNIFYKTISKPLNKKIKITLLNSLKISKNLKNKNILKKFYKFKVLNNYKKYFLWKIFLKNYNKSNLFISTNLNFGLPQSTSFAIKGKEEGGVNHNKNSEREWNNLSFITRLIILWELKKNSNLIKLFNFFYKKKINKEISNNYNNIYYKYLYINKNKNRFFKKIKPSRLQFSIYFKNKKQEALASPNTFITRGISGLGRVKVNANYKNGISAMSQSWGLNKSDEKKLSKGTDIKIRQKYLILNFFLKNKKKDIKKKIKKVLNNEKKNFYEFKKANILNKKKNKITNWKKKAYLNGWIAKYRRQKKKMLTKKIAMKFKYKHIDNNYILNITKLVYFKIIKNFRIKINKTHYNYLGDLNNTRPYPSSPKNKLAKSVDQKDNKVKDQIVLTLIDYFTIFRAHPKLQSHKLKKISYNIKKLKEEGKIENKNFKLRKISKMWILRYLKKKILINSILKSKRIRGQTANNFYSYFLGKSKIFSIKQLFSYKHSEGRLPFIFKNGKVINNVAIKKNKNNFNFDKHVKKVHEGMLKNKSLIPFISSPKNPEKIFKLFQHEKHKKLLEPFQAKNFIDFIKEKKKKLIIKDILNSLNSIKNEINLMDFKNKEEKLKIKMDRLIDKARKKIVIFYIIELFKKIEFFKFTNKDKLIYPTDAGFILKNKKVFELMLSNYFYSQDLKGVFILASQSAPSHTKAKEFGVKEELDKFGPKINKLKRPGIFQKEKTNKNFIKNKTTFSKKGKDLKIKKKMLLIIKRKKIINRLGFRSKYLEKNFLHLWSIRNARIIHSNHFLSTLTSSLPLNREDKAGTGGATGKERRVKIIDFSKKFMFNYKYININKNNKANLNFKEDNKVKKVKLPLNKGNKQFSKDLNCYKPYLPKFKEGRIGNIIVKRKKNKEQLFRKLYNIKKKINTILPLLKPKALRKAKKFLSKAFPKIQRITERQKRAEANVKNIRNKYFIKSYPGLVYITLPNIGKKKASQAPKGLVEEKNKVANLINQRLSKDFITGYSSLSKIFSLKREEGKVRRIIPVLRKYPTAIIGRRNIINLSTNFSKENKINMVKWIKWRINRIKKFDNNISTVFNKAPVDIIYFKNTKINKDKVEKKIYDNKVKVWSGKWHAHPSLTPKPLGWEGEGKAVEYQPSVREGLTPSAREGENIVAQPYFQKTNLLAGSVKNEQPIIHYYLKSMSIFNRIFKGSFVYFNKFVGFNFNHANNNNKFRENIFKFLFFTFKKMFSLISKPVFVITPDKVIIHLFYFVLIPSLLKNKKIKSNAFHHNSRHSEGMTGGGTNYIKNPKITKKIFKSYNYKPLPPSDLEVGKNIRKNKIVLNFRAKKKIKLFKKLHNKNKIKLKKLVEISLIKMYPKKFEKLCSVLSKFFKKKIELNLIRLHYPYKDSHILASYLALVINKIKFVLLTRKIFKYAIIKKLSKLFIRNKYNLIPSFLTGLKMKVAGRLMNYKVIPRKTVKLRERGTSSIGTVNYTSFTRITGKNRRGAYSITVSAGQNFF